MPELFLATLTAAALIGTMFAFAVRNRKQGWRKQRGPWFDVQPTVVMVEAEAKPQELPPLRHIGDLNRLHDVLSRDTQPVRVTQPVPQPVRQRR
jgi:hypothetical protein